MMETIRFRSGVQGINGDKHSLAGKKKAMGMR
jgi:hypothetical protein